MADSGPAAGLLRNLGAPFWDMVITALDEHVTHWHKPTDTRRHRQPIDRLPMTGQQLANAQEMLALGADLSEIAESLDMTSELLIELLRRQYLSDYLRLCERALCEQPVNSSE